MSALLYGSMLGNRIMSSPGQPPAVIIPAKDGDAVAPTSDSPPGGAPSSPDSQTGGADAGTNAASAGRTPSASKIGYWQDALAALVPAEVLAIHGIAVSVAKAANVAIPAWVFVALALLTLVLSLVATITKSVKFLPRNPATYAGALIATAAFVLWSMLQPSSAFDSLGVSVSPLNRALIPVFGAVILGLAAGLLSWQQQNKSPNTA
jgi:hypothetical protein